MGCIIHCYYTLQIHKKYRKKFSLKKEEEGLKLKNFKRTPLSVIPQFKGLRETKQMVGSTTVHNRYIQNVRIETFLGD